MLKRALNTILVASLLMAGMPPLAHAATGTVAPFPKHVFLNNNGDPCASCKLFTYTSGTSTKVTTYTEATLSSANTNPIVLDSSGRASIFLTPGVSYKFVLAPSTDSDPPVAPIWTVDAVDAVPPNSVSSDTDVLGTAGEGLAAGNAVYLSDGQGGRLAGTWYKTDSDFAYSSTEAPVIGFATVTVSAFATVTVRVQGLITGLSGLTPGALYQISSVAGDITASGPTLKRTILIGGASATVGYLVRDGFPKFSYPPVGVPTFARQTANVTKNNSTAFAFLTGVTFDVPASTTWAFKYYVHGISAAAADIKFTLTGPAAPTAIRYGILASADTAESTAFGSIVSIQTVGGIDQLWEISGLLRNGTTAGTVEIQMAQLTANVSDTICYTDSYVLAWRIN